jgi:hypothetical protein
LAVGITEWITQSPDVRPQEYFASLDLTHALLFAVALNISAAPSFRSEHFLANLVRSPTTAHAIARFCLAYVGRRIVRKFIVGHAWVLPLDRAVSLLCHILPAVAVEISLATRFRVGRCWSSYADVSNCFIAMCAVGAVFECLLFCKLGVWLGAFLLDDSPTARFNAVVLIANLVRTEEFGQQYRRRAHSARSSDDRSGARASYIAARVVALAPDLAERIASENRRDAGEHRADAYIHALAVLMRLASSPPSLAPLGVLFRNLCLAQRCPFSRQLADCLSIIATAGWVVNFKLLVLPFSRLRRRVSPSVADGLAQFLPPLFKIVIALNARAEFAPTFLEHIMFQRYPLLNESAPTIMAFCAELLAACRTVVLARVEEKLESYAAANFVMLVDFCELARLRKPLLGLMAPIVQQSVLGTALTANDFLGRVIDGTEVEAGDQEVLVELMKRPDLSDDARATVSGFLELKFPGQAESLITQESGIWHCLDPHGHSIAALD